MSDISTATKKVVKKNDAYPLKAAPKFAVPTGPTTARAVITELFQRSFDSMSQEDFKWFSYAGEQAGVITFNLCHTISGIAGLLSCDKQAGNFQDGESVANLLWFIEDSLRTIDVLRDIGAQAEYELRKPEIDGAA